MLEQEPKKKIAYCKKCIGTFSCESTVAQQKDGSYTHDDTRHFQFIYLDGAINDRIIVLGAIEDCEIRKRTPVNNVINIEPNKIKNAIDRQIKTERRKRRKERKKLARLNQLIS